MRCHRLREGARYNDKNSAGPRVVVFFAPGICGQFGSGFGTQKPEDLAQQSSDAWLALTEQGKYADGYQEAAQYTSRTRLRKINGKALCTPAVSP